MTTPKTPQIVSVSRRTDIPALYSDWFFNRLSDGYCRVTNPFNAHQVKRVSLTPADVKAFVFWSKNPQPMMDHLSILDDNNYQYLFLFTLNNYPAWLEANIPDLAERTNTFRQLSGYIGADRTVWRYDPIIFTAKLDIDYHNRVFESLCRQLTGLTRRVIISYFDPYGFAVNRMKKAIPDDDSLLPSEDAVKQIRGQSSDLSEIAAMYNIQIQSCVEKEELTGPGITPGACIDSTQINNLFASDLPGKIDSSQRTGCLCAKSIDIGVYDTCNHGCSYCYAVKSERTVQRNVLLHNAGSNSLTCKIESQTAKP